MKGQFKFEEDYVYKMPAHFGGEPFYPVRTVYGDMTAISVSFETGAEDLARFIPEVFEITDPLVNVQYSNCRDVDWMSGGEYRLIQLSVPVRFCGEGEELEGEYPLVIWENKACPIIGGREEDGMPKIFADVAAERHYEDHWFTAASHECNTFLTLDFERKAELSAKDVAAMNEHSKINFFGWRYISNLGKGGASLSHATLYPQEAIMSRAWSGEGRINWPPFKPEMHLKQSWMIDILAKLPIVNYLPAMMMKSAMKLNVGDSRALP